MAKKKDDMDPDAADEQYAGDEDGGGEESNTEGLPGGRIPNPPPRDPWVSRVVDDPSNPPDAVLLSGYVGDAAEEGRSRIYTDASLSSYVEVSDEDVLHHEPADTGALPEGGSLVWVRSDALVTPGPSGGTGSGGAAGGDFFTGPVLEQNRKPGTGTAPGVAIEPVQITLLTIAGCYTQRFGCTIFTCPTRPFLCRTVYHTLCSYVCQQGGGIDVPGGGLQGVRGAAAGGAQGQDQPVGPTGYFHCGELVGQTGWQGCGQQHQVSLPGCIQTGTCGGREGTDTVQAAGMVSAQCQKSFGPCPSHLIGCTGYLGCGQPHISLPGCVHTGTCGGREGTDTVAAAGGTIIGRTGWLGCGQPSHLIGCTGWQGCGQPHISLPGCIHTGTCPQVSLPGCVHTGTCPSAVDACPTRICGGGGGEQVNPQALGAARPGGGAAAPTTQYAPECPTFGFTCTYVHCPPQSVATVCTQIGCQTQQCTFPPGCEPPTGPNNTLATVCTQINCPSFGFTCTVFCQAQGGGGAAAGPGNTTATVCTQIGCAGGADTVHAAALGGPGSTTATVCTQLCHTSHIVCPPTHEANCSMATVCTQIGCHTAPQHCIPTIPPLCPHTGPNGTVATVCTQIGCPHISLPGCVHTGSCAPGGIDTVQAAGGIGPHISYPGCVMPDAGVAGPGNTTATVCTQIGCPPHTGNANCSMATVCTQIGCHTAPQHCIPTIPPLCPPHTGPNGTVATVCTQIGCPHISLPGCVHTGSCAPGGIDTVQAAGVTGPHISLPGCVWHAGGTGPHISYPGCVMPDAGVAGPGNTTATVCTQFGCPPHTGNANCSMATVCTQIGCHTAPQHCIPTLPGCPPHTLGVCTQIGCETFGFTCTAFCQAQGGGGSTAATTCTQIGCSGGVDTVHAAALAGPGNTTATVCTQFGCPPHEAGLRAAGPGNTTATVCTQIGCHTFGFTCTAFCQGAGGGLQGAAPGGGGAGAAASTSLTVCGTVARPQQGGNTTATVCTQIGCPSFGFTCTAFCQGAGGGLPGGMGGGGGQGQATAATVCTQGGCIPRTRICPPTFQPGCGPDHEHGGSTAATLCTLAPFCPPTAHCPGQTVATLCTQIGCQPHTGLGCPRTSTCPPTQMPGCGGGGILPSYGPWCAGGGGLRAEAQAAQGVTAHTAILIVCTYVLCG